MTCSWKKRRRRHISLQRLTCSAKPIVRRVAHGKRYQNNFFKRRVVKAGHLAGVGPGKGRLLGVEVLELEEAEVTELRDGLVRSVRGHDELQYNNAVDSGSNACSSWHPTWPKPPARR